MPSSFGRAGLFENSTSMTNIFSVMLDGPRGGRSVRLSSGLGYGRVDAGDVVALCMTTRRRRKRVSDVAVL